ncbi:hypothetical protein NL676_000004 [Syzygium grande]|nr:hypothetical protein NL676_000004 [Syzygium grande]
MAARAFEVRPRLAEEWSRVGGYKGIALHDNSVNIADILPWRRLMVPGQIPTSITSQLNSYTGWASCSMRACILEKKGSAPATLIAELTSHRLKRSSFCRTRPCTARRRGPRFPVCCCQTSRLGAHSLEEDLHWPVEGFVQESLGDAKNKEVAWDATRGGGQLPGDGGELSRRYVGGVGSGGVVEEGVGYGKWKGSRGKESPWRCVRTANAGKEGR